VDLLTLAVIVLSASSLGIPILQILGKDWHRISGYILIMALLVSIFLIGLNSMAPQPSLTFDKLLTSDSLGGLFALVTLSVTLFVAVASTHALRRSDNLPVYYGLLSFTALGMLLLSYSQDLLMLFISWELMSLPTYVLAGFDKNRIQSNEASVKYAVIGAMSSAIILYAISLTYGLAGTTQIIPAVKLIASQPFNPIASMTILLFVAGFGFKMSIVPFHMWIPDAYEGAPSTISTLLAAATKKAGFVAATRVLLSVSTLYVVTQSPVFTLANIFAVLALVTMTLGNVAALTQRSMARLLAYSSIAQAGYILIGFVAFSYGQQAGTFTQEAVIGMTGALFHVVNHAIMKGVAFLAVTLVLLQMKRGDVEAYSGLGMRMPYTAFTIAVAFFALAGVPPLNGFWSKLLLFLSVIKGPFAWLAVAGILNSVFSLGYYAWVIKRMYLDEPEKPDRLPEPYPFLVIFAIAVGLIIGLGIFPQQVINFASGAVPDIIK